MYKLFLTGIVVFSAFFLNNCTFDGSGPRSHAKGYGMQCRVDVEKCQIYARDANFTVKGIDDFQENVNQYVIIKPAMNMPTSLYYDNDFNIKDIGCNALQGTARVQTGLNDQSIDADEFMELKLNSDVESLYVAYDARADPQPNWLLNTDDYELLLEEDIYKRIEPCYIETTIPDETSTNNQDEQEYVKLNVYKRRNFSKQGQSLILPGNNYGGPGWSNIPQNNQAMYVLFIKPKEDFDCTKVSEDSIYYKYVCLVSEDYNVAKAAAQKACQENQEPGFLCTAREECGLIVRSTGCERVLIGGSGLGLTQKSFQRHSEIEFDKTKSTASIKISDKNYTLSAHGHIHFQYLLDDSKHMEAMQVNALNIKADSFGDFTDIKFALLDTAKAHCQDKYPPGAKPCQTYQIPKDGFVSGASCSVNGNPIAFTMTNINPIDINLTQKNSFNIKGGPLYKILNISGKSIPVEVSIDLTGTFVNFAPFAEIGKEFKHFSECSGAECPGSNLYPIILDAGGSFDVDERIPSANYAWYENYGLSTERLWGKGERIEIPPCSIGFGVHYMTLVIRDNMGVPSTKKFKVRVIDTKPPVFTSLPGDRFFLATKPGKVKINIGKATGGDNCQSNVMISSDAPDTFEAGVVTPVTWKADDGFGNDTKAIQNVYVFLINDNALDSLVPVINILDEVIVSSQKNTANCTKGSTCHNTLENIEAFLTDLIMLKIDKIEKPTRDDLWRASFVKSLHNAQKSLQEVLKTLDSGNGIRKAYGQLEQTRNYLRESIDNGQ